MATAPQGPPPQLLRSIALAETSRRPKGTAAATACAKREHDRPGKPCSFDQVRFIDLLGRLEKVEPQQDQPSVQTLDERWQFASCQVIRTTYLRSGTVAHTSVSF